MTRTDNPFPGMNPFLELRWADAHTRLITYIGDALAELLPEDLTVRAEERVLLGAPETRDREYRSDLAVRDDATDPFPALLQPEGIGGETIAIAEPEIVAAARETERWLEIRDGEGELVTVLELLSPRNKSGGGRDDYRRKQRDYLAAGVNLVEIDLLRGGVHSVAVDPELLPERPGTQYVVCVTRVNFAGRFEVYRCSIKERLPAFRVPLRASDPDVPLDLQPLIDRCYQKGRYWQMSDPAKLEPPLPPEENSWLLRRLAEGRAA